VRVIEGDLKACPFCGSKNIVIDTCHDLGDCENFERCEDTGYYSAVCNRNDGGCGASTGYKPTIKAAVEAWNRREN